MRLLATLFVCLFGANAYADFRSETIYFVLPTRFSNGDPANDFYNRDRIDVGDPHWRGDFKGLIAKLPYIRDLGFSAIWITPPVENRSGLDYHGYHAYDWNRIDPRLESEGAQYQDLIDAAHAQGIKIIQDVVLNHSSSYGIRGEVWVDRLPIKYYRPRSGTIPWPYTKHLGDYTAVNREDNDNPVAPEWFRVQAGRDPEGVEDFVDPTTSLPVAQLKHDTRRFFNTDAGTLDREWYHQEGWIAGGDWENQRALQRKHIAGDCLDLATENANVRAYLNDAVISYLRMGVDAVRVDTAKHIERDELLGYVDAWKAAKPGTSRCSRRFGTTSPTGTSAVSAGCSRRIGCTATRRSS